ncbi:hypothetical protein P5V15_012987 [Pogonomyrmex californicus]
MIEFKVSAPGKLNLFGEHMAKYNRTCIVASLDLRTTLKFSELPDSKGYIEVKFSKIALCFSIPVKKFQNFFDNCVFDDTLYKQVLEFIPFKRAFPTVCQTLVVFTFFYLLTYIAHKEKIKVTPFQIDLETQLNMNENVGGLTSIIVCYTTCFLQWQYLKNNTSINNKRHECLDKIFEYSSICQVTFREFNTFITDIAVSVYDRCVVKCTFDDSLSKLIIHPHIKILLVNTQIGQSKKSVLEKMKKKERLPLVNSILNNIEAVTITAFYTLKLLQSSFWERRDIDANDPDMICKISDQQKELLPLIRMQHELFDLLDMTDINLNIICKIAQRYKLAGKYTNIDGRKYVYIWCLPETSSVNIMLLTKELQSKGYSVMEVNLARDGVKIQ